MRRNPLLNYIDDNLEIVVTPKKVDNPDSIIHPAGGQVNIDAIGIYEPGPDGVSLVSKHKLRTPVTLLRGDSITITYTINIE